MYPYKIGSAGLPPSHPPSNACKTKRMNPYLKKRPPTTFLNGLRHGPPDPPAPFLPTFPDNNGVARPLPNPAEVNPRIHTPRSNPSSSNSQPSNVTNSSPNKKPRINQTVEIRHQEGKPGMFQVTLDYVRPEDINCLYINDKWMPKQVRNKKLQQEQKNQFSYLFPFPFFFLPPS